MERAGHGVQVRNSLNLQRKECCTYPAACGARLESKLAILETPDPRWLVPCTFLVAFASYLSNPSPPGRKNKRHVQTPLTHHRHLDPPSLSSITVDRGLPQAPMWSFASSDLASRVRSGAGAGAGAGAGCVSDVSGALTRRGESG